MGRGASDLTATALASALGADACEIYTDVTGVFSADPRIVPQARKLSRVSFDEMLEMAGVRVQGARPALGRVRPQPRRRPARAVELHVGAGHGGSSRQRREGEWPWKIRSSRGSSPTSASRRSPCSACPTGQGISAALFEPLAAANVNVDMIVQNTSTEGKTDISFTMPSADMAVAEDIVRKVAEEIGAGGVNHDQDIAKVSLVGAGMKSSPGIAAKMFRTLADEDVNIEMISTSTIRISVVVASRDLERAARALHTAFGLDSGLDYAAPLPERR